MRLTLISTLALGALAACSQQPGGNAAGSANDTAPENAIAANAPAEPAPLNPPAPGEPGGLANDMTPMSEAPFTPESAQGAANVVQTYYALIGEGKYRQAWALWEEGGKASGMSAAAFAASFGKYSEYHANIGAPGRIDAGAGQRYVTVPVQAYGRMKAGGTPFNLIGTVTLHRTGDIDGATADQKQWHIRSADLAARPGADPASDPGVEDNRSTARYRCMDGSRITARFDPDVGRVTVETPDGKAHQMTRRGTSTGIRYSGGGYSFSGKGEVMQLAAPDAPPLACRAIR